MRNILLFVMLPAVYAAEFPSPYNSEVDQSKPMPAAEAVGKISLPEGFKAVVYAAEPDVQNPIGMAWDGRGRLWVAENYTYAERSKRFDLNLRDRILIFEGTGGNGAFKKRRVFADDLQMLTSIEVGHGGVWAMCPPQLLFIPDRDQDGIPDGVPEVVLDGFTVPVENYHNFANGLRFGPDGWLYGRCGASSPGEIGAPGIAKEERIPIRGTIWRYHPDRKIVEVLSSGCTNPWGHDWDEAGELFFINTVNGQLWHGITGAHYVRPHTIDPNPRAYELIDQHADHWHFDTAQGWSKSRAGKADVLGGGHAHVGMMIYQGNNWPVAYRGRLFTLNLHGRRMNQEILERMGSGYNGRHGQDLFQMGDPWFRGMELSYGPDGGVFVFDWSDIGECHESTGVHRTSGRIYKMTYGEPGSESGEVQRMSATALVNLQKHPNEWFSRQGRLELEGRPKGERDSGRRKLMELFNSGESAVVRLRALWTLYAIGGVDSVFLERLLHDRDEHVRTWAIRLLSDDWPLDTVMSQRPPAARGQQEVSRDPSLLSEFARMARNDPSGLVRLALASVLQRLPIRQRADLAEQLLQRMEDAQDHNLPLLVWYGLIPWAEEDLEGLANLAGISQWPLTRKLIARRVAEDIEKNPAAINRLLRVTGGRPETFQHDIVSGMVEGLAGWRKAVKPGEWDAFAAKLSRTADLSLREKVLDLSVLFGDGRALDGIKRIALNQEADLNARKVALQTLIDNRASGLRELCEKLMGERFLNSVAARGLAYFDDLEAAERLVKSYPQFHPSERGQLLSVLVSRGNFARALIEAIAAGKIARTDISAYHVRQIQSLNDTVLNKKVEEVWGALRESPSAKKELIAKWKARLTTDELARANKSEGRALFNAVCAACHTLYGEGGKTGPDLTGGGRGNLDYLLENVIDPSAVVTADFRMAIVELKDGRVLNGIIAGKTERTMTLKTMTESVTIEKSEVVEVRDSALSLMPDGLLDALSFSQARDLVAYLMHQSQVPLPANGSRRNDSGQSR